jgi:dimethylargininase
MPKSFSFTHAICRKPSSSIINGLRAVDNGAPEFKLFEKHHSDYITALKSTGAKVMVLDAMDAYPDSVFVEDAALCLPELAIVMRPGAPTRLGEAKEMAPHLSAHYSIVRTIDGPGFIEGGDILVTEQEILVGKSARTNSAGVAELGNIVADYGYQLREVETPPDVLHFKTDCSLLDEETILSTRRLAQTDCFNGYRILYTEDCEEACANSIRFNDLLIMPKGFQRTAEMLDRAGYNICQVGNSEAAKLDGGMSCLSLRFSPS